MSINLTFAQHQLAISFGRKRGRPRKKPTVNLKDFVSRLIKLVQDRRYSGHPVSRIFRHLFESKKVKKILGFNLAVVVLFTGVFGPPISAFSDDPQAEITTISPTIVELTTDHSIRVPLDSLEITQSYHLLHRAVDLNGELGEPVYPIMDGIVEQVAYGRFGYGNYVVVDHGLGFKSLYAHLSKIVVDEGEEVNKNTVIGTVGSTGWTNGSHLHLEVYDDGRNFNPLTILK